MATKGFEYFDEWCSHLGNPNHDSVNLYEPMSGSRLKELELMRRVNIELAEKREADQKAAEEARARQEAEEALAAEAKKDGAEVKPDAVAEVKPEDDEDEVPHMVTSSTSAKDKHTKGLFVPTKKNADNSLFTKYG